MSKKLKVKQVVRLRQKELAHGNIRLYLDIYLEGSRCTETLRDLKFKKNPRTPEEKRAKAEVLALAEQIRADRESKIIHDNHGIVSPRFRIKNFIDYFQNFLDNYKNKDVRIVRYCFEHFKKFVNNNQLPFAALTETLFRDFKKYLEGNLNGETPYNYFTKLKRVVKLAYNEGYLRRNHIEDIRNTRNEGIKKAILTFEEINILAATEFKKTNVKNAFLFCFNTGLRFCDVKNLRWKDIQCNMIIIREQQKTKKPVNIHLNKNAKRYLGEYTDDSFLVFNLPSYTQCLRDIKSLVNKAGIRKNITWHSARHSLGTYLVSTGQPINILAGILGHESTQHTQKYIRYIDELGKAAINSIPEITESQVDLNN